jgi:dipeptidyl aminopeptidase/acylaminoacyl peptidase
MPEEQAPLQPSNGGTFGERNYPLKVMRREFQVSKAFGLNYLLYVPERVEGSRDEKCPTILFLHGLGESGGDASAVLRQGLPPYVAQHPDFPFIVIAPQCHGTHGGRSWRIGLINSFFIAERLCRWIISASI